MEVAYTYWEANDGWLVGYLNDYPDHLTQGHDIAELEEMLAKHRSSQRSPKSSGGKMTNGYLSCFFHW